MHLSARNGFSSTLSPMNDPVSIKVVQKQLLQARMRFLTNLSGVLLQAIGMQPFVYFCNEGYLQVFWYQTNNTIHNQQQIFSVNIQLPQNFEMTDEYQIFTPILGATSITMTNFEVSMDVVFPFLTARD